MKMVVYLSLLLFVTAPALAKEFEIFDGQFYNGLYYPVVDIIEWGEQDGELPHMEFHVHSKDKPVDLTVVAGKKNGRPVLWIMYDLKFRNERVCRHVLAPAHFKEGMKLYTYRDNRDSDYDNIYIYSEPRAGRQLASATEYKMNDYQPCSDELASNMPGTTPAAPAPASTEISRVPASGAPATVAPAPAPAKAGKGIGIDYDNNAVPFSY